VISEAFSVLSGAIKFHDGDAWIDGDPADFLYRRCGAHGFRKEAEEPASILMLFALGAPREHYFEGLAQLVEFSDVDRREWFVKNDNLFCRVDKPRGARRRNCTP
jgi:hypothetical protein